MIKKYYNKTLLGAVGKNATTIFKGNKRFFELRYLERGGQHRDGERQKILADRVILGRDISCAVRFDESCRTVSRKHAEIIKEGNNWKIMPLSSTNSTFLNGRKISKEWFLQDGDIIQLASDGPKLLFTIPKGDASKVSSIPLAQRMTLLRKQILSPYRKSLIGIAAVALIGFLTAAVWISILNEEVEENKVALAQQKDYVLLYQYQIDSLKNVIDSHHNKVKKYEAELEDLKKENSRIAKTIPARPSSSNNTTRPKKTATPKTNSQNGKKVDNSKPVKSYRQNLPYGYKIVDVFANGNRIEKIYGKCGACGGTTNCNVCFGRGGIVSAGYGTFYPCHLCGQSGKCKICKNNNGYVLTGSHLYDANGKEIYVSPVGGSGGSGGRTGGNSGSSGGSSRPRNSDRYGYKDCHRCFGSGKCQTCSGRGYTNNPLTGNYIDCPNCYRSGKCSICGGTGQTYGIK